MFKNYKKFSIIFRIEIERDFIINLFIFFKLQKTIKYKHKHQP